MASVFDVSAYILDRQGPMTTWKLQKLVHYSQAWHAGAHGRCASAGRLLGVVFGEQ